MASQLRPPAAEFREPEGHWALVFQALRTTLLKSTTSSIGGDPQEVLRRQRLVERDLAWADRLQFDAAISDEEFWRRAAIKPFYAGKRSSTIRSKEDYMLSLLRDPEELCRPEWDPRDGRRFQDFIADGGCVPNPLSLERTVRAARKMQSIRRMNSGQSLIKFYVRERDWKTDEPMRTIHDRLSNLLDLGYVTTLHFMADLGLPVVKPDRVVNRLAIRLGVIDSYVRNGKTFPLRIDIKAEEANKLGDNPYFNWTLQSRFARIANETGITMRALDFVIVKLGQQADPQHGYARTICGDQPLCHLCEASPLCAYGKRKTKRQKM
jgi:hypothetical protein